MIYKLFQRNPMLAWLGTLFFVWTMVLLLLLPGFEKQVLGVNALYKPLKFAISLCIFIWSMAWFSPVFKNYTYVRRMSMLVVVTAVFEQSVITWQAASGRMSHFNRETPFDAVLFALMGIMIVLLTAYVAKGAFIIRNQPGGLTRPYQLAVFNGLMIFVLAGLIGGVMSALNTHAIGGEMGGKGIFFFNWHIEGGDLRISHFIGMHALQLLPWVACKVQARMSASVALTRVQQFTYIYAFVVLFTFIHAIFGKSIVPTASASIEQSSAEHAPAFVRTTVE